MGTYQRAGCFFDCFSFVRFCGSVTGATFFSANTHGDWYVFGLWFSPMDGWIIALQNQALAHDYGADVRIVQPVPSRVGGSVIGNLCARIGRTQSPPTTNNMKIEVFTKSNCPNCVAAKQLLKTKGMRYEEISLDDEKHRWAFFLEYPDVKQMPQIFFDGQRVGGLSGLQVALDQLSLL